MKIPTQPNEETDKKVEEFTETSEERKIRIQVKNRRHTYLERHPEYFESSDLELADPLLYDRCIRRFQSAADREADGRSKGYSGILEADLYRSEAKLSALRGSQDRNPDPFVSQYRLKQNVTYTRGPDGQVLPEDPEEIPNSKEDGMRRWRYEMMMRFLRGEDNDFSYKEVDESEGLDILEIREEEDKWFDDEEPGWTINQDNKPGETGVQDF